MGPADMVETLTSLSLYQHRIMCQLFINELERNDKSVSENRLPFLICELRRAQLNADTKENG